MPQINNKLDFMFEMVSTFNSMAIEKYLTSMETFRSYMLIMHALDDMTTTKVALTNYLRYKLPRLVGGIANRKIHDEDLDTIYSNDHVMRGMQDALPILQKAVVDVDRIIVDDDTKHMLMMSYVTCATLESFVHSVFGSKVVPAMTAATPRDVRMLSLISLLLAFIINDIVSHIKLCSSDVAYLRNKEEQLREKSKENELKLYSANDEERQEQMERKKIGDKNWYVVGNEETGEDVMVHEDHERDQYFNQVNPLDVAVLGHSNHAEESRNYSMRANRGENAEDDEVDEDIPSQSIFVPDRD